MVLCMDIKSGNGIMVSDNAVSLPNILKCDWLEDLRSRQSSSPRCPALEACSDGHLAEESSGPRNFGVVMRNCLPWPAGEMLAETAGSAGEKGVAGERRAIDRPWVGWW